MAPDAGAGVDIDRGHEARQMVDRAGQEIELCLEQPMRDAVEGHRPEAGIQQHFPARARCRVARHDRVQICDQPVEHAVIYLNHADQSKRGWPRPDNTSKASRQIAGPGATLRSRLNRSIVATRALHREMGALRPQCKIARAVRADRQPACLGMRGDQFGDHGIVGGGDIEPQRRAEPRGQVGQGDPPARLPTRRRACSQQQRTAIVLGRGSSGGTVRFRRSGRHRRSPRHNPGRRTTAPAATCPNAAARTGSRCGTASSGLAQRLRSRGHSPRRRRSGAAACPEPCRAEARSDPWRRG